MTARFKFKLKGISNVDTTKGVIWKQLLLFALPILFSNFLQQLYNTIDLLIVSNYATENSLGAVGSTGSITNLLVGLFVGVSIGASVAVAQAYGAGDYKEVYKTVHSTVFAGALSGLALTLLGLFLTEPLLTLMGTPEVQLPEAVIYMRIIFVGMIPMSIYNMTAAILRAVGDSARPLIFLIISSVVNLLLDLIFVAGLNMGVAGAAWATVIAQVVSAILGVTTLLRSETVYRLFLKEIRPYKAEILKVLQIGLPAGMQSVVISLANTIIQSQINNYGPSAVEGYAAANRIDGFYYMAVNSFTLAVTTFVGQNIGAGRRDRARKGVRTAIALASGLAAFMGLIFFFIQDQLLGIFNASPESMIYGRMMLTVASVFYWVFAFGDVLTGAFRGAGRAALPMISSVINMCAVRLIWIYFAQMVYRNALSVFLAYPVSWILQAILMIVFYRRSKAFADPEPEEKGRAEVLGAPEGPAESLKMGCPESHPLYEPSAYPETGEEPEGERLRAKQREGIYVDPEYASLYGAADDEAAEASEVLEAAAASEGAEPAETAKAAESAEAKEAESAETSEASEAAETAETAETTEAAEAAEAAKASVGAETAETSVGASPEASKHGEHASEGGSQSKNEA